MFMTYRHTEMPFGDTNSQHWRFVEQEVIWPWFYLELVRKHRNDALSSMLLIPSVPDLQHILLEVEQEARMWLTQAQIVTPSHINGTDRWLMEPLLEVCVALDEKNNQTGHVYKVAGNRTYQAHTNTEISEPRISHIIFSAAQHLRS